MLTTERARIPTTRATYYEIILEGPAGERYRVPCWSRSKNFRNLARAYADNLQAIKRTCGDANFYEIGKRSLAFVSAGGWTLRYSGRTEREAAMTPAPVLPA